MRKVRIYRINHLFHQLLKLTLIEYFIFDVLINVTISFSGMAHCEIFSWGPESWRHPDCAGARGFLERRPLPTAPPAPTWFSCPGANRAEAILFYAVFHAEFFHDGVALWQNWRRELLSEPIRPLEQRALVCPFPLFPLTTGLMEDKFINSCLVMKTGLELNSEPLVKMAHTRLLCCFAKMDKLWKCQNEKRKKNCTVL